MNPLSQELKVKICGIRELDDALAAAEELAGQGIDVEVVDRTGNTIRTVPKNAAGPGFTQINFGVIVEPGPCTLGRACPK